MRRTLVLLGIVLGLLALYLAGAHPGRDAAPATTASPPEGPPSPSARLEHPPQDVGRRAELPSPEEEALVQVRVVTTVSYARDAERVPRIAFQVLAEHMCAPAPGSRATFPPMSEATVHPHEPPLLEGRTDENGEAWIELPEAQLFRDEEGRVRLRVRVVESGYKQLVGGAPWTPPEDGEVIELRAMAVPGATARGRVVDAQGRGVGADVRLREWTVAQGVRKLNMGDGTRQLADGWFELDFDEDVRAGVLLADAGARGTGARRDVDLELDAPPQDLEIVVTGGGRLRGRVVDHAGEPAAGLALLVWLAELDDRTGSLVLPEPASSQRRAEGGGHLWVRLSSDVDGRFDVEGLRDAAYVVRARTGPGYSSVYPIRLTDPPVVADGAELQLTLGRPHLAVRLSTSDGEEWAGRPAEVLVFNRWDDRVEEWPESPTILVFRCASAGGDAIVQGSPLTGKLTGPGGAVFEVPDGARYLVGAFGGGFLGDLQTVEVSTGAGRVAVELVAPRLRELGSVSVRPVFDGHDLGVEDAEDDGGPEFDVYLESLDSAAVLLSREEYGTAPFVLTAPVGRYRVVVEGRPWNSDHGGLLTERELGRTEVELELVAGDTRDLTVEIGSGARLEIALAGEMDEEDRVAILELAPWLEEPGNEGQLERLATQARLFLERERRRPEPVYHKVQGIPAAPTHLEPRWPLGETHTSQVLPTGTYRLVARMPGGREASTEVTLRVGETAAARLRF